MQCVEADARLMAPKPCIERLTHRNIQMIPYVLMMCLFVAIGLDGGGIA